MKEIPLYKQIQQAITNQIKLGNLRPGDRIPSEKELAEQFHVSLITTKNALSGLADEGIVVRMKGKGTFVAGKSVFGLTGVEAVQAAQKPGAAGSAGMIGLIIPSMRTKVEQRLLDAIESAAQEKGFSLVIRVSRGKMEKERESIQQLYDQGLRGLILFPIGAEHDRQTVDYVETLQWPIVLIDRYFADKQLASISSDNTEGARQAVAYLFEQGASSIALLTPPVEHSVVKDRLAGFSSALAQAGLRHEPHLHYTMPYELFNVHWDEALRRMEHWLSRYYDEFSGLLAIDVELARVAVIAMRRLGLEPGQKRLVTFDDPQLPGIAYMRQDEAMIAEQAITLLWRQIHHGGRESDRNRIKVPTQLVLP